ncbi:MAG TPA: cytochrome c [Stellaceae bacterium]|nr:cytochrome c [Stellaceae bacterium]
MRIRRIALAAAVLLCVGAIGFVVASQQRLIPKIEPPPSATFPRALVAQGAKLAAVGNCAACHTAPGGADYAGNRPIATPSGTVYSTNITPAPGSGIGHWSEAAFRRAMRQGIAREGRHLYPAFPYDHYARLSDGDLHALYAFIMTRPPVETYQQANDLAFPLGQRWLLAFWNLLFLDEAPFRPEPQHSAQWNRGSYLVSGLGHCGDCHAPRTLLGVGRRSATLAGGTGEGWRAPALNAASPAPVPWDAAHLYHYLRDGWDIEHGAAAGPMQPIVDDLGHADAADVRAIAAYLAAAQGRISPSRRQRAAAAEARAATAKLPRPAPGEELGATLFAGACAACHTGGPAMVPPRGISLALSTAINEADPRDAILIVLDGIRPQGEQAGPWMPSFAGAFTDAQIAGLLGYIRAHYGSGPAWRNLATYVHDIRDNKGRS